MDATRHELGVEYELKLTAPIDELEKAFAAAAKGEVQASPPSRARRLTAVYYDTPDRRLQRRGAALRVRREGRHFVQTVKLPGADLDRLEHQAPVAGLAPELDRLPKAEIRRPLGALFAEELAPVFVTDVTRRTSLVTLGDALGRSSRIEVALDAGKLTAGERAEDLAEIELELADGDRAQVFALARTFVDAGARRLLTRSKAARGYALADGSGPGWAKAAKVSLERRQAVGDALGLVLDNVFAQWWANHDAAFDGRDPEGVHQLRVAVRRLRSALALFGGLVAPSRLDRLKNEAQWLMAELGDPRDLDVFATEMLPPVAGGRPNDAALARLRSVGEDAREQAYARLREIMASARYTHFVLELGQWIVARGWYAEADGETHLRLGEPLGGFADRMLAKRAKAVLKRGRHFEELDAEHRHEVRKTLKKLRYATDFFRDLYPEKAAKPYLKRLEALQDAFGHMNDMAAAEALLGRLVEPSDPRLGEGKGLVLGWYAHAAGRAEADLVADWRAFATAEPFWDEGGSC